jgi:hypothetical protein
VIDLLYDVEREGLLRGTVPADFAARFIVFGGVWDGEVRDVDGCDLEVVLSLVRGVRSDDQTVLAAASFLEPT